MEGSPKDLVIRRKPSGPTTVTEFTTVVANTTRFRDTGLTPGAGYQYQIQAETLGGWSASPSLTIPAVYTSSTAALPVIARGDYITTLINEARVFQPLANDQGKNLTVTALTQGAKGTATITNGGTTITYVPNTGATGEDLFTYTATASDGGTSTGYIQLNILANHNTTPPPNLVYDNTPAKTLVDNWEFNDAANTTIANCANSTNAALKFASGTTPKTDGAGILLFDSTGSGNFRTTASVSPGEKVLGASNAGYYELSVRFAAANLAAGTASGAFAGIALRDSTAAKDMLAFRLQEVSGNLEIQFRNDSIGTLASFAGTTLPQAVEVRAECDLAAKTATVFYKQGTDAEVKKGTYAMDPAALKWNCYRVSTSTTDFGSGDYIKLDYLRCKSLVYPASPTAFQMWMDAAQGSVTPSADKLPGADPDGDGLKNLAEFAFGGNPFDAGSRILQNISGPSGTSGFIFTLPVMSGATFQQQAGLLTAPVNGVFCSILGSTNLGNFDSPVEEVFPPRESGLPPAPYGWEYRSFRLSGAAGSLTGFMRAEVDSP